MYLEEVGQSTDGTHEILNASLQTSNQALLVTNIQTQGIENKEKCSSRYSLDEFKLKLNHFSQNHDAHYCSLFEKMTISQMFCFYHHRRTVLYIISSIHRTLSNPLAFPLQTLLAGVGLDLRIARRQRLVVSSCNGLLLCQVWL